MANRIKGITVEIGGDTTGLENSLKSVNDSLKKTQSQLKDVETLLKLDPSNVTFPRPPQELAKGRSHPYKEARPFAKGGGFPVPYGKPYFSSGISISLPGSESTCWAAMAAAPINTGFSGMESSSITISL